MRTKINLFLTILTLGAFVFTSCSKYPGFKKDEKSGIYYKFHTHDEKAAKPKEGDILTLNIRNYLKIKGKDSVLLNSASNPMPFQVPFAKSVYKGDINTAFGMMNIGDSATFILNAKDFFMKTARYPMLPEGIDSTTKIYFDIKILKAQTEEQIRKEKQEKIEKYQKEEPVQIEEFVKANNMTSKSASGIYTLIANAGSGRNFTKGDFITMHIQIEDVKGKKIYSSYDQGKPTTIEFGKPIDTKGFDEVLAKLKKGAKATALVPSHMGFGEQGRQNQMGQYIIEPYSPIVYKMEIIDLKTKAEHEKAMKEAEAKAKQEAELAKQQEPQDIQNYITANKISAKPTISGLYYIEKSKGKGVQAVKGKMVSVKYVGKLLNGKIFDQSKDKPFEFSLGQGQVIPGWDEGIALMKEGGKATLIIPSKLAYGENGAGNDIPPFSPLVFDVELIKVK